MTAPTIDPVQLASYLDGNASELLSEYFRSGRFTGGSFERFAGGGDRPDVADRFTSDDIVAVSLLGVRIPGLPALSILGNREAEFSQMLAGIDAGVDLWEAEEAAVGPGSAADRLWRALVALPGIGWVTAGKLLARKRPRLIRSTTGSCGRRSGGTGPRTGGDRSAPCSPGTLTPSPPSAGCGPNRGSVTTCRCSGSSMSASGCASTASRSRSPTRKGDAP